MDNIIFILCVPPLLQAMSWLDGYECYSTSDIDKIAASSEQDHPVLVLLAHDGDNAFGGGNSYYQQCVSSFVNEAASKVNFKHYKVVNELCTQLEPASNMNFIPNIMRL